jgi:regulator of replication initiation timing
LKLEISILKKDLKEMTEENGILKEENNKLKLELNNFKQSTFNYILSFDLGNFEF